MIVPTESIRRGIYSDEREIDLLGIREHSAACIELEVKNYILAVDQIFSTTGYSRLYVRPQIVTELRLPFLNELDHPGFRRSRGQLSFNCRIEFV